MNQLSLIRTPCHIEFLWIHTESYFLLVCHMDGVIYEIDNVVIGRCLIMLVDFQDRKTIPERKINKREFLKPFCSVSVCCIKLKFNISVKYLISGI